MVEEELVEFDRWGDWDAVDDVFGCLHEDAADEKFDPIASVPKSSLERFVRDVWLGKWRL